MRDAVPALQSIVGLILLPDSLKAAADLNGDTAVSVEDARLLLRRALGLP